MDYEDFLRQRQLIIWDYSDPRRQGLVRQRLSTADQFAFWVNQLSKQKQAPLAESAANGVLVLLAVACSLLDRQIAAQADAFRREGGFYVHLGFNDCFRVCF